MTDYQTSLDTALELGWPLILIQYLVVCGEYFYAKRSRRPPLLPGKLDALVIAQLLSPALYFVIYPVMPGSSWAGSSWLHISAKVGNSFIVTCILAVAITFFSFCHVIQFGDKK